MIKQLLLILILILIIQLPTQSQNIQNYAGYLFVYFTGNGPAQEQVHYAVSKDGFSYYALNNNKPVIDSKTISTSGGVRDPHILRGEKGWFYMVLTDLYVPKMGWRNTTMVMLKSKDLINWKHTVIDIPKTYTEEFNDVYRVWAPQTIYDRKQKKYMLYWSMLQPGGKDIIYYAYANKDFTGLESKPKQLLFKEGACIDGDIVFHNGKYHLFFKNEDRGAKGIMLAVSDKINEGYNVLEGFVDQTDNEVEGSGTLKLIGTDKYILMYDVYMSGKYQFCESNDLKTFKVIDADIKMNFHPRHGSVIPITKKEMDLLLEKWGGLSFFVLGSENSNVKTNNVEINESSVSLPVKLATDISKFNPKFKVFSGVKILPKGKQDFSKGANKYTLTIDNKTFDFNVNVKLDKNPVLAGYYADPEIIYSEREGKYYLYPTCDGFIGWSGKYFEVFESEDLVNWSNKGVIVDLRKDVAWAARNAWAPCAIEKKEGNEFKYYYYFTAAQKIGVAVADNPTGPFKDSGKPLINFKPKGVNGGQEIDPDVFHDPRSGRSYLYWGNGYMAVAELNDDMVSIKKESMKVMTPDKTYREGTEVFYRDGKYYFLWSEDDTRSPNYRVRYATARSPLGPLNIPENNLVIEKDPTQGIYGTGHNSVIKIHGSDEWYIVYHRFNHPNGIKMGDAAGFHREVCIDKLEFNNDGTIKKVTPTIKGIVPIKKQ